MKYHVEEVADLKLLCGEGPVWDILNSILYFTDCIKGKIFSYYPKHENCDCIYTDIFAASLALQSNGGLLMCGIEGFAQINNNGIYYHDTFVDGIKVCNLNDIIADPIGRLYSGQIVYKEYTSYAPGFLFMLDTNGRISIVDEGYHISNGMGFNVNVDTFYVADSFQRRIFRYDYNVYTGQLNNKAIFFEFNHDDGLPDGLTVDSEGYLWVAMFYGSKLIRIDPDGILERSVRLPFAQPTSVAFGGEELNQLFITSAAMKWETSLAPKNHNYEKPTGGALYKIETGVKGKSEFKSCIDLKMMI